MWIMGLYLFLSQHAARYLANQDWVKNDSLKTIENTAVISSFVFSTCLLACNWFISLWLLADSSHHAHC